MRPLAAIYVRISQDREGQGLGVARQEADCRELAERLGFDVLEPIYDDNDKSASRLKTRPDFERLLKDAEANRFQAILAWHTDRLYRRPDDLQALVKVLGSGSITVHTVKAGALDLTTATGQAQAEIFASISQMEVRLKAERQRRKELANAEEGKPRTSRRAFGFEPDGVTWRQPEAEMIQQATRDVLGGTSLAEIVRRWNNAEVFTAGQGRRWAHSSVREVLTRWRNAGIREHNAGNGRGGLAETKLYPGTWEPLVDRAELEAVRRLLFDPRRLKSPGTRERKHLLSFFIICAECGGGMQSGSTKARTGNIYKRYVCGGGNNNSRGTPCRSGIAYEVIEEVVRDHVADRLAWPDEALLEHTRIDRDALQKNHDARAAIEAKRKKIHGYEIDDVDKLPMLARVKVDLDRLASELEVLSQRAALAATMSEFRVNDYADDPDDWRVQQSGVSVDVVKLAGGIKLAREFARVRFDALDIARQRQIIQALIRVKVLPSQPGVQYRGHPERTAERIVITDLDPRSGEPL